jgi:hypothetical protein
MIVLSGFLTLLHRIFCSKAVLVWVGGGASSSQTLAAVLRKPSIYTVLVPMFHREPEVLPILAQALRNLDYHWLNDVKIVLKEN